MLRASGRTSHAEPRSGNRGRPALIWFPDVKRLSRETHELAARAPLRVPPGELIVGSARFITLDEQWQEMIIRRTEQDSMR